MQVLLDPVVFPFVPEQAPYPMAVLLDPLPVLYSASNPSAVL
jgi:hypothetical protein